MHRSNERHDRAIDRVVEALDALCRGDIAEAPVASFGFQFAGTGAFVGGDLTEEQRESDSATLERLIQLARAGERRLTTFPAECEFCGYRQAGWCSGVTPEAVIAEQALAAETES